MQKFLPKSEYILLSLLVLLNINIRLPLTSHELGIDSFYIHALSTSISSFGSAKWLIHPTSFFGLYPYSYPSAQPFVLSGLSQSLNISLEYTILLFSILLGIFGFLASYILAKEIFKNDLCAILVGFLYSLSPVFISYTCWQASTRSMFLAMLPLVIWMFVRYGNRFQKKYAVILLAILVFLLATHRVAIFLAVTIFAFIVTFVLNRMIEKYDVILSYKNANIHVSYILLIFALFLFFIQFTDFAVFDLNDYNSGFLYGNANTFETLLNMLVDYVGKMGILLFFAVGGFIKLLSTTDKDFGQMFIALNVIMFLPLMALENYSPIVLLIFLVIMVAIGIFTIIDKYAIRKTLITVFIITCIVSSITFDIYMINYWDINKDVLDDKTVAAATFIKYRANGTVVANQGDLASKITAFSAVPTIPLGGVYANNAPPGQIAYGFVKLDEIDVRSLQISEIKPSSDTLYALTKGTNANKEWVDIIGNSYWTEESKVLRSKYNAHLVIESDYPGMYLYWSWRGSGLLRSLQDSGNKIYSNNRDTIYSVQ